MSRLHDVLPTPAVIAQEAGGTLVMGFMAGQHGQDLIDDGNADGVLSACGSLLRRLHSLNPALLAPAAHDASDVIRHGDFGPNNVLLDPQDYTVTALLDWEFSGIGMVIDDVAWCEWIVRMHHPGSVGSLPAFFDAYGARPSWPDRQAVMVSRCRWLEGFSGRWDPHGPGVPRWQERAQITSTWVE